jgi:hypothetical protein
MYHPTKEQMQRENYLFVKGQYWDLILFYLKQPQTDRVKKNIKDLQDGWNEWEAEDFQLNKNML